MESSERNTSEGQDDDEKDSKPISGLVSQRGIKTSADFADFMSALMDDVVNGRIEPAAATAACKAGESLLGVVRMQLNHTGRQLLRLSGSRIGETENKKLSGPCEECGFPLNSDDHMRKCGRGITED